MLGFVVAWVACSGSDPESTGTQGLGPAGLGPLDPFPSRALIDATGHLAIGEVPASGETPVPVDRLAWRTGFSPAQTAVVRLPDVDPGSLPSFTAPRPGEGSVRLYDLTVGEALPCMAELDAHPDAESPALLVRPLVALPVGHDIAVVILDDAMARPAGFDPDAPHHVPLIEALSGLGVDVDDVALAWDFPIGDGTGPLRSALDQIAVLGPPTFTEIREASGGDVAPKTFRAATGTFPTVDFLTEGQLLDLQPDATVRPTGEADAHLYVHIPNAVADAPAGTVPVVVFGHGIFSQPSDYLDDREDADGLLAFAEEAGVIVVATNWRGLTAIDRLVPVGVAGDFGRFPELTDLLIQGHVDFRTLIEGVRSGVLLDDPVFDGASGQALPDPDHVSYYGISLGGIEGAVALAHDPPLDAAVFHVGGAMWSTMLERSSNWLLFEALMVPAVPDPGDRQLLYAMTQLWWDAVDPMSYTEVLSTRSFLLQESVGDEQVPNLTTDAFARSVGLSVLEPSPTIPWGLTGIEGPLPPGSRALSLFDPGIPLPPATNRPAPMSGAHTTPRTWGGARRQLIDHLAVGAEGQVVHHCGATPCIDSNTGD